MRALVARDLADAQVPGLSADRRFATAYNAAGTFLTMKNGAMPVMSGFM
jgi:hypothetical protein